MLLIQTFWKNKNSEDDILIGFVRHVDITIILH